MIKKALIGATACVVVIGLAYALGFVGLYREGGFPRAGAQLPTCHGWRIPVGPDGRAYDGFQTILCIGFYG